MLAFLSKTRLQNNFYLQYYYLNQYKRSIKNRLKNYIKLATLLMVIKCKFSEKQLIISRFRTLSKFKLKLSVKKLTVLSCSLFLQKGPLQLTHGCMRLKRVKTVHNSVKQTFFDHQFLLLIN